MTRAFSALLHLLCLIAITAAVRAAESDDSVRLNLGPDRVCFYNEKKYFRLPYQVVEGDTVTTIADSIYGNESVASLIAKQNSLEPDAPLEPDSTLYLPVRRFCLRLNPGTLAEQYKGIRSFVDVMGQDARYSHSWSGRVVWENLSGKSFDVTEIYAKAFVPRFLTLSSTENAKKRLILSIAATSWRQIFAGHSSVELVEVAGLPQVEKRFGAAGVSGYRRHWTAFEDDFDKLSENGDETALAELVRREASVVYETVLEQIKYAVASRFRESETPPDDDGRFAKARRIAELFPPEYGRAGMLQMIATYDNWTRAEYGIREAATELFDAAGAAVESRRYKTAIELAHEALPKYQRIGDQPATYSTYILFASAYKQLRQYEDMRIAFERARDIAAKVGDISNYARLSVNIASVVGATENLASGIAMIEEAAQNMRSVGLYYREAYVHTAMAALYREAGDYSGALYHHQQAYLLDKERQISGTSANRAAQMEEADLLRMVGRYRPALKIYTRLLTHLRSKGKSERELELMYTIGSTLQDMGDHQAAIELFQDVIDLGEQYSAPKEGTLRSVIAVRHPWTEEGKVVARLGESLLATGQSEAALKVLHNGYAYYLERNDIDGQIEMHRLFGKVYVKIGYPNDAIRRFNSALALSEEYGRSESLWELYHDLAVAQTRASSMDAALRSFDTANARLDEAPIGDIWRSDAGVSRNLQLRRQFFLDYGELLLALHAKNPSAGYDRQLFTISERAKSIRFQVSIARAAAKNALGGSQDFRDLMAREGELIARAAKLRAGTDAPPEARAIPLSVRKSTDVQLLEIETSLATVQRSMRSRYPDYVRHLRRNPLSVEDVQTLLRSDQAIVSYQFGLSAPLAFVISPKSFELVPLATTRKALAELIGSVRIGIDRVNTADGFKEIDGFPDLEQFQPQSAHELYAEVFAPVRTAMGSKTAEVYISADDLLYTVPFGILVTDPVDATRFESARARGRNGEAPYLSEYRIPKFLIEDYTFSYLPSVSMLSSASIQHTVAGRKNRIPFLAFADPVFRRVSHTVPEKTEVAAAAVRNRMTADLMQDTSGYRLKRLVGTQREADDVAKALNGSKDHIYVREAASEFNLYQVPLDRARVVLFATHGLLGGDFSGGIAEPALALSVSDEDPRYDGFLTMTEVLGLDLSADLVILSACDTYGRAENVGRGEGFAGLARSFIFAGAGGVVVTHWSVESESTRNVITSMFVSRRDKVASNLSSAKLDLKSSLRTFKSIPGYEISLAHPYFWGAFVHVGR